MNAADVMTTDLLTLTPEMTVAQAATMLAARGVSGAPVLDAEGRLVGMLTEGDLIRRLAAERDRPVSWLLGLFAGAPVRAEHYARSHGRRVGDVMTTDLATVEEATPLPELAALLERRRIRRVPVLRGGRLVGVVSRADLVRTSLTEPPPAAADGITDREIAKALQRAMREQPWVDAYFLFPQVRHGIVTFHGYCRSDSVQRALRVLAEQIPGVREVRMATAQTPDFLAAPS